MRTGGLDALSILSDDHQVISRLFVRFEEMLALGGDSSARQQLARQVCQRLMLHATGAGSGPASRAITARRWPCGFS